MAITVHRATRFSQGAGVMLVLLLAVLAAAPWWAGGPTCG